MMMLWSSCFKYCHHQARRCYFTCYELYSLLFWSLCDLSWRRHAEQTACFHCTAVNTLRKTEIWINCVKHGSIFCDWKVKPKWKCLRFFHWPAGGESLVSKSLRGPEMFLSALKEELEVMKSVSSNHRVSEAAQYCWSWETMAAPGFYYLLQTKRWLMFVPVLLTELQLRTEGPRLSESPCDAW